MVSSRQRHGACGPMMALFDKHQRCAQCRDKGPGNDPCVLNQNCEDCDLFTPEQMTQLSTPTKLRKEKQKSLW